jgi:hypothetical protein
LHILTCTSATRGQKRNAMLNIQLISDVHGRWDKVKINPDAQLILALGDLTEGGDGMDWLASIGKPVIYVPGNHEYYGGDLGGRLEELRELAIGTQVIVADKQTITAGNVRFLCATLWTDHNSLDPDLMSHSLKSLNDYRNIKAAQWAQDFDNNASYQALLETYEHKNPSHTGLFPETPEKMNPLVGLVMHQQALDYLTTELDKPWPGKTIVLSHHAPSLDSLLFAGYFTTTEVRLFASVLKRKSKPHKIGAYASSLDYLFSNHRIDLWMHGHLHEGIRYSIYGCDVITNPTGYIDSQNVRYNPSLLINSEDKTLHMKMLCLTIYQSLLLQSEMGTLVKKCLMQDERVSKTIFGTLPDVTCFAKLYNGSISALLSQKSKDRKRPEFHLEPLNIKRLINIQSEENQVLDAAHRIRFLHEILHRIQENELRSKNWLRAINSAPELKAWTVEGDI